MPVFIMYTLNLSYDYCMIFVFFASKNFIVSKYFFSKNKHEKINLHSCTKEENNLLPNKFFFFLLFKPYHIEVIWIDNA